MSFLISVCFILFILVGGVHGLHPAYEYEESVSSAFNRGEYWELITVCEQGLDIRPNSVTMLNLCGQSLFLLSRYGESEKLFLKLLEVGNLQNNSKIQALAHNNIGEIHRIKRRWDSAKVFYKKAIELNRKSPDKLAVNLYNLGKLYKDKGDLDRSLDTFTDVLEMPASSFRLQGLIYNELGLIYELKDEYEKAEEFYNESLVLLEGEGLSFYLGIVRGNLGRLFLLTKDYDNALLNLEKGLSYARSTHDDYGLIRRLRHLSVYYIIHKDYRKSALYLEESISIKKRLGDTDIERDKAVLSYLRGE